MIKRFIADLNTEQQKMPSTFYNVEYAQALDLSRRRDSVETRKTPSPYTSNSSRESTSPSHNPHPCLAHQIKSNHNSPSENTSMTYSAPAFQTNHESPPQSHTNLHYAQFYPPLSSPVSEQNSIPLASTTAHNHQAGLETRLKQDYSFNTFKSTPQIQASILSPTRNGSPPYNINPTAHINSATTTLPSLFYQNLLSRDGKLPPRPFKAFPRDPLAMAATFTATDALLDTQKAEKYSAFRKRMMEQIRASNGGRPTVTNPRMRRNTNQKRNFQDDHGNDSSSGCEEQRLSGIEISSRQKEQEDGSSGSVHSDSVAFSQNGVVKDAAYFERRKKNNAAAKKSRDRRRIKEDEIAVRAAFLEHENIELRIELAGLKNQLAMIQASTLR